VHVGGYASLTIDAVEDAVFEWLDKAYKERGVVLTTMFLHGARYVYSEKYSAKEHGFVLTVTVNPHRTPDDDALAKEVAALAEMLKTLTGQAFVPVYKEAATVG
jgi:hypothetical protein